MQQQTFTADHVWALAVIADRINGGYSKEGAGYFDDALGKWVQTKEPNKVMVKQWLRESSMTPTEEDIAEGQRVRNHFKGYLLKQMSGKISDFESQALKIAQKEEFTGRDMLEFAIVSCLPNSARREQDRKYMEREAIGSTQLRGSLKDRIIGEVEVLTCNFSDMYRKYRITGRLGESIVDFWLGRGFNKGELVRIEGKIKMHRGDNTTQLNYVKIKA